MSERKRERERGGKRVREISRGRETSGVSCYFGGKP